MSTALDTSVALSTNKNLPRWVENMSDLLKPSAIYWVDGSEYDALCAQMVATSG
jgi:GTP-dependent phosphoenolpyruvate carboxykinase